VRFCRLSKKDSFSKAASPHPSPRNKIRAVRRNLTMAAFRAIYGFIPTLDLTRVCTTCCREKSSGSETMRSKPFCKCGAHRRIRPRQRSSLCSGIPLIPSRIIFIGQGLAICLRNLRYTMIALECFGSIKPVYISIDVERITAETRGLDFHFLRGFVTASLVGLMVGGGLVAGTRIRFNLKANS